MTTANLSVGLDTSSALKSLDLLKSELQKVANTDFTVNTSVMREKIQTALQAKAFDINIGANYLALGNSLRKSIANALRVGSDNKQHHLDVNTTAAVLKIRTDVTNAFNEAEVRIKPDQVMFDKDFLAKRLGRMLADGLQKIPVGIDDSRIAGQVQGAFKAGVASAPDQIAHQIQESLKGVELLTDANIGVNPGYLQKSLNEAVVQINKQKLGRTSARIPINDTLLANDVFEAVKLGLFQEQIVNISETALSASVARAVQAGMGVGASTVVNPKVDEELARLAQERSTLFNANGNRPGSNTERGKKFQGLTEQMKVLRAAQESSQVAPSAPITVPVTADTTSLQTALANVFAVKRTIDIDDIALTTRVRNAIEAGSKNHTVHLGVVGGASGATGGGAALGSLDNVLVAKLATFIDKLPDVVADGVTAGLRKSGGGGSKPQVKDLLADEIAGKDAPSKIKGSKSFSALDPATGGRIGTRESIDSTEATAEIERLKLERSALAEEQARIATGEALLNQKLKQIGSNEVTAERAALEQQKAQLVTSQALLNQKLREIGKAEAQAQQETLNREKAQIDTKQALLNQKLKEIGKVEATSEQDRLNQQKSQFATSQALLDQKLREINKTETQAQQEALNREKAQIDTKQALLNQKLKEIGKAEVKSEQQKLNQQKAQLTTGQALLNQKLKEIGKNEAETQQAALDQQKARINSAQSLLNQRIKEIGKAETAAEQADLEQQKARIATGQALINQKIKEIGKAEVSAERARLDEEGARIASREALVNQKVKEIGKAEAAKELDELDRRKRLLAFDQAMTTQKLQEIEQVSNARTKSNVLNNRFDNPSAKTELSRAQSKLALAQNALGLINKGDMGEALRKYGESAVAATKDIDGLLKKVKSLREAEVADRLAGKKGTDNSVARLKAEMGGVYNDAKYAAQDKYDSRGQKVAGAKALSDRYGEETAGGFLNNRALVADIPNLEKYTKSVGNAGDATKRFSAFANEAHSAARGLAGSMGALWLTWGSLLPLAAGAAIGATLRSVIMVGKELEYQLTMVSQLGGGATISMDRFGDAVRGSLSVPTEAANAMRGLAQNGLGVGDALIALPAILRLATAGEMELGEAALGATGVMEAFNLQVSDLGRIGDVFSKAAASSNTSVTGMVESMKQASTVSDFYHITLEQTAASLALLAKRNITGTAAGTAFRNMMVELATPTKKASAAMKTLGIELYDSNNQLKPYPEIMAKLRDATINLNEKGKLTFLNEVFGERGAKAMGAILSDFDQFGATIDILKDKSKGFAASLVEALGDTVDGKLKRLFSEFQISTATAFNNSSDAVKNFTDALRVAASSTEFQEGLASLTTSLTEIGRFLLDNAKILALTVGGWVALKLAVMAIGPAVMLLAPALGALQVSLLGVSFAAKAVMSSLTLGLSLVVTLVAEYFLLRDATNAATEAQEAYSNRLKIQTAEMEKTTRNLDAEISSLSAQNALIWEGATALEAKAAAQKEMTKASLAEQKMDVSKRLMRNMEESANYVGSDHKANQSQGGRIYDANKVAALAAERAALEGQFASLAALERGIPVAAAKEGYRDHLAERGKIGDTANRMNREIDAINKKGTYKFEKISLDILERVSTENAQALIAAKKDEMDQIRDGFESLDKAEQANKEADARRLANKEDNSLLNQIKREEEQYKRQMGFKKQIDETRFSSERFGPDLAAIAAEARERDSLAGMIEKETMWIGRLAAAYAQEKDPANKEKLIDAVRARGYNILAMQEELAQAKEVAAIKAEIKNEKDDDSADKTLAKLREQAELGRETQAQKYNSKQTDPVLAAAAEARLSVEKSYADEILKVKESIAGMERNLLGLNGELLVQQDSAIRKEQRKLTELEQQALVQSQISASNAADLEKNSLTAKAGYDKFWADYTKNALSSSQIVQDAMSSMTDTATLHLEDFFMTGKFGFKEMTASILNDIGRMIVKLMIMKPLMAGIQSSMSGGSFLTTFMGAIGANPLTAATSGLSPGLDMPPMPEFAKGTNYVEQDMIAMIHKGESINPKEYNPAADGRISGGGSAVRGSGGGDQNIEINITVQGGETNKDTGQVVSKAVVDVIKNIARGEIATAQRPGGLLNR